MIQFQLQEASPEPADTKWDRLSEAFSSGAYSTALDLIVYLAIGGVLALYLRLLYRWSSPQASGDSISRVFPLLTMVTVAVISVVKASLALSLGLVGALSIVRFRAAIKDPEELVYLFVCIGVGLSLGAEQPLLAVALVVAATVFVVVFDRIGGPNSGDAYVTVVGPAERYFGDPPASALEAVRRACPRLTVDRCDVDGEEGQLRVQLHRVRQEEAPNLVAQLKDSLPGCQVSYVNAKALL